jgi:hypothetical protein
VNSFLYKDLWMPKVNLFYLIPTCKIAISLSFQCQKMHSAMGLLQSDWCIDISRYSILSDGVGEYVNDLIN